MVVPVVRLKLPQAWHEVNYIRNYIMMQKVCDQQHKIAYSIIRNDMKWLYYLECIFYIMILCIMMAGSMTASFRRPSSCVCSSRHTCSRIEDLHTNTITSCTTTTRLWIKRTWINEGKFAYKDNGPLLCIFYKKPM